MKKKYIFLILFILINIVLYICYKPSLILPLLLAGMMYLAIITMKKLMKKDLTNLKVSCISFLVILSLVEISFCVMGVASTYAEKNQGKFISNWDLNRNDNTWYHTWTPSSDVKVERPEFFYHKKSNALGVIGEEFEMEKDSAEFRVIVLGDSFTEGVGAPMSQSFPNIMDSLLNERATSYSVFGAGVSGSDIVYNYVLLRDKLMPYQPDMIIYALNNTDIESDLVIRGGMERFREDGTVVFRNSPRIERFYATSRIFRLFCVAYGYDENLLPRDNNIEKQELVQNALEEIAEVTKVYENLLQEDKVPFVIVKHPLMNEFEGSAREIDKVSIRQLQTLVNPSTPIIDLVEVYEENNLMDKMNYVQYYWPIDKHHNAAGYKKMAEAIAIELEKRNLIPQSDEQK